MGWYGLLLAVPLLVPHMVLSGCLRHRPGPPACRPGCELCELGAP